MKSLIALEEEKTDPSNNKFYEKSEEENKNIRDKMMADERHLKKE